MTICGLWVHNSDEKVWEISIIAFLLREKLAEREAIKAREKQEDELRLQATLKQEAEAELRDQTAKFRKKEDVLKHRLGFDIQYSTPYTYIRLKRCTYIMLYFHRSIWLYTKDQDLRASELYLVCLLCTNSLFVGNWDLCSCKG